MNQYDHLKNKLHQYKVDIDKDKLWESTSHAIPRKKRRGAALIILFAGLLISGWLLNSTSLLPISGSQSSVHSDQNGHHDPLAQNVNVVSSDPSTPSHEASIMTIEEVSSTLSTHENDFIQEENHQRRDAASKTIAEDGNKSLESTTQNNNHSLSKNAFSPINEFESSDAKGKYFQAEDPFNEHHESSSPLVMQAELDLNSPDRAANIPIDYLFKAVSQIPVTTPSVIATGSHKPIIPSQNQFLQSVQLIQGVGFSTMRIHSLNPASDLAAAQLEEKMSSLEILSTSATATISLPEKFSLVAGLQLTQLSTVINHDWETTGRVQEEGVPTIIIGENGIPQPVTGNTDLTRTTHIKAKRFTTHQQADIVVALHREIWNARRLSFNAFVKGGYNLSYTAEGTTLDNEGVLNVFSKNNNPYKRTSPLTIGGGFQMNYRLAAKWNLTSNLTFDQLQYQLKEENISVQFQHSGFSLGLGIGYVF